MGKAGAEEAVERQAAMLAPLTQLQELHWCHRWPPHGFRRWDAHLLVPLLLPPLPPRSSCSTC